MKHSGKLLTAIVISALSYGCNDTTNVTYTRQLGEPCNEIDQCLSGSFCENGICRKLCAVKEECPSNYTCESNRCILSFEEVITCGNGEENQGEACDDGNRQDGDGCSAQCNVENNYHCVGWPSACKCADGFQDSNHNGICLPDCPTCNGDMVCKYNLDGSAAGCGCPNNFQDSNSDGTCLPDCSGCDASQICLYENDGSAHCGCADNMQDYDNNGICERRCGTPEEENCGDLRRCDDSTGTPRCTCVILVKNDSGSTIWDDSAMTLPAAVEKVNELYNGENPLACQLWLEEGEFTTPSALIGNYIDLFGGFRQGNLSKNERAADSYSTIKAGNYNNDNQDGNLILVQNGRLGLDKIIISDLNNMVDTAYNDNPRDYGGAVYLYDSEAVINDSRFINNSNTFRYSSGNGAAIYMVNNELNTDKTVLTLKNSLFSGNNSGNGGALYFKNGKAHLENNSFKDNHARVSGGAVALNNSQADIINCDFTGNYTTAQGNTFGGAIMAADSIVNSINSNYRYNHAYGSIQWAKGGTFYLKNGAMKISNALIMGSFAKAQISAYAQGGVIYNDGSTDLVISDSRIIGSTIVASDDETSNYPDDVMQGSVIAQYNGVFKGSNLLIVDSWSNDFREEQTSNPTHGAVFYNIRTWDGPSVNSTLTDSTVYHSKNTIDYVNKNYIEDMNYTLTITPANNDGSEVWHYIELKNCNLPYNLDKATILDTTGELEEEKNYNILKDNCRLPKELPNIANSNPTIPLLWQKQTDFEENNTTTLTVSKELWESDSLVGKYVLYTDQSNAFSFHLPIIANGTDFVTVDGRIAIEQFSQLMLNYLYSMDTLEVIANETFTQNTANLIVIHDLANLSCNQ